MKICLSVHHYLLLMPGHDYHHTLHCDIILPNYRNAKCSENAKCKKKLDIIVAFVVK